jgi:hypothetical protein
MGSSDECRNWPSSDLHQNGYQRQKQKEDTVIDGERMEYRNLMKWVKLKMGEEKWQILRILHVEGN